MSSHLCKSCKFWKLFHVTEEGPFGLCTYPIPDCMRHFESAFVHELHGERCKCWSPIEAAPQALPAPTEQPEQPVSAVMKGRFWRIFNLLSGGSA